jgi:hypothetical protein
MDFNERFLALRDVKRTICQRLAAKYRDITEANSTLGIAEVLQEPRMQPDEEPENRDIVTDEDIAEYKLRIQTRAGPQESNGFDNTIVDRKPVSIESNKPSGLGAHTRPQQLPVSPSSSTELEKVAHAVIDQRMVRGSATGM